MSRKFDIKIKEISKINRDGYKGSQLQLEFTGSDVCTQLINTLRRGCLEYIPVLAFCNESINIEKSTSVFNNDYMRLRLSQMIIPNLKIEIDSLQDEYWHDINYSDPKRLRHPDDKDLYEIYINVENTTPNKMNVTTNHLKLYLNGEEIKKFDSKYPELIIQLRPKEIFNCHMIAVLGIAKRNNIWSAIGSCYYSEINDNKFLLTLESTGQISEYESIYKACISIIERMKNNKEKLKELFNDKKLSERMEITLVGEDHTVGLLINKYLQDHTDVSFSGLAKKDLLVDEISIIYVTNNKNPLTPLFDAIDDSIKILEYVRDTIKKMKW